MLKNNLQSKEFLVPSPDEMRTVASQLVELSKVKKLFLIYGDLGAGKTTLVKALGALLNFSDPVSSPTFSLVNEYAYPEGIIYHIDLYRLETIDEALNIGIEEYLYGANICLIEWPEIIEDIVPDHHKIQVYNLDDSMRKVIFS